MQLKYIVVMLNHTMNPLYLTHNNIIRRITCSHCYPIPNPYFKIHQCDNYKI